MTELIHHGILRGGGAWSGVIRRGQALRLTDPRGTAAVAAFFYNASQPLERYNMPDTLKAQFTAFISAGNVLMSDMGRVLLSVTADTCGWHDTFSGHQDEPASRARFGAGTYQRLRNGFHRNTRDNVLVELAKHGLGRRDLHANLNAFVKVAVDDHGRMAWIAGNSRPGAAIELRAEMDVLAILSNTPHPLDPATSYAPPDVELAISRVPAPALDDRCRISRAENARAFARTEELYR